MFIWLLIVKKLQRVRRASLHARAGQLQQFAENKSSAWTTSGKYPTGMIKAKGFFFMNSSREVEKITAGMGTFLPFPVSPI